MTCALVTLTLLITQESAERDIFHKKLPIAAIRYGGLPFDDQSFDYVHQRLLVAAIPSQQWPRLIGELVRVLQPGGWIELIEGNPFPTGTPAMDALANWETQALQ